MLGCRAYPWRVRLSTSQPSPRLAMPQPVPCVRATTPSTPSVDRAAISSSVRRTTCRATVAEQFTVVSTPM